MKDGPQIKFIADVMLGKLARWLRILGLDTAYSNTYLDDQVIGIAETEGRVILTRDTRLVARRIRVPWMLIESDFYKEQVRQVLRTLNIDPQSLNVFSRCIECNVALTEVEKEVIRRNVPPYVFETQERFAKCTLCGRVYWRGTHVEQIIERMERIWGIR